MLVLFSIIPWGGFLSSGGFTDTWWHEKLGGAIAKLQARCKAEAELVFHCSVHRRWQREGFLLSASWQRTICHFLVETILLSLLRSAAWDPEVMKKISCAVPRAAALDETIFPPPNMVMRLRGLVVIVFS